MYRIAIITINYNNKRGLEETINSVRNQSCKDFEFIVVDGASTDGSIELLRNNIDIISEYVSEKDTGIFNAMNKGVKMATSEYLIFLNSGDSFVDTEVVRNLYAQDFDADILQGDSICTKKGVFNHIWSAPKYITCNTFYSGSPSHQSAIIRKALFDKTPYDETLRIAADKKFFFEQLIIHGASYRKLNMQVARFDVEGISNNLMFEEKKEQENRKIIEALPSIWLFDYDDYIGNRTELERWVYENRNSILVKMLSMWFLLCKKIKRRMYIK